MRHEAFAPIGAGVDDVHVGCLGSHEIAELRRLLAEHGVLVIRSQNIDDVEFVSFLRCFGDLVFTEGETPVDGYSDLNVISNVGRKTPPKSTFHVDTTYVRHPPAYTALRAVEVPAAGGQTLFSNQYRAYATLPAADRSFVDRRKVTHRVTGLAGMDGSAVHPLVLKHPLSHQKSLYLSAPARCVAVSGMSESDGAEFIEYLVDHSTREPNVYRHSWSPGDVVMWDNRCVMHKADHSGVVGDRVMHRGMVAGG
ncbi:TauD/TfdA family dioxygenase [Rhodococcus sp. G-MC3]|uniref:TauD/TfdA dioxygenase family protein n=1 Tax=Rhodococcus sp. G-MC3 TaxID=3046209 RepID=UPI0024B9D443|nr:TauD/TfdA family dioxygenase [Rhodococcus sp. G-MC3]MDJ0392887.1 TauD/TfdA family dioxygenase [Rhodococcus sp. G-MC3]